MDSSIKTQPALQHDAIKKKQEGKGGKGFKMVAHMVNLPTTLGMTIRCYQFAQV